MGYSRVLFRILFSLQESLGWGNIQGKGMVVEKPTKEVVPIGPLAPGSPEVSL